MTRTDIYNASSKIFSELPDEDTFALDMTDSQKAAEAFQSMVDNKDKYDEMGIALPSSVEEFQAIITDDPKKKSTSQEQGGKVGSTQTQQSNGLKPVQSSNKSFAGSRDYLESTPKFGEIPNAPKLPGTQTVVPAQQATKKPETQKRTIVRGEEADQAIAESLKPEQVVSESTQPVSLESKYKNVEKLETQADKITSIIETGERTKNFTPKDIENNYNEYAKNALDDYLDYLNFTDQGGSQYKKTKEQLDYYRSLGDKLFNDEQYADDYKRYIDLQQDAILNVNKQDAKYVNKLKTKYDWDTFNKKTSEVELKLSNIENQIKNISSDGTPLTPLEQRKYDDLLKQYNQIQTDYTNFSSELGITQEVINQMSNSASRLAASQKAFNSIENEDNVNSRRLKEYKAQLLSNKKAKEDFYGDKDQSWYEQFGKGLLAAGEQLGSSLIKGSISMVGDLPQLLTDAIGIEGYGVTDRLAEAADNINSYVDLVVPQLEDKDFPGFVKASSIIGNGLGSVGTFMLSGGGAVKMAQGVLKTSAAKGLQTASRVGAFSAASSMSAGQMYDQLIEEGFTPAEASRYALAGGLVMGAAEMIVPEDQLLANSIRRTFIGTLKNTSNLKQASEEALKFIYNRGSDVLKNSLKEGGEEAIGQFAQDLSLQATSSISGKEVDGLWEIQPYADNFLAGGGVGGVIELLKFGTRNSKYTNRFKESTLLELAENYDDISNKMSQINPEDFNTIGEKYAKLKNVNNALKDIPGFDDLSHADKSHVLALAYNKQVILDSVKQSGLDKSNFDEELTRIDQDIQTTLNKPKDAIQEPGTEEVLPRQQGATTETGGEPQGMGQGVQGEKVTQEGQEVSQEGVKPQEVKKEELVNKPLGEFPENTEDFTGIGAGYLKNNLWASRELGRDSKTSLLGNVKNEVLNKGKQVYLYFIDPKLSEGSLDTENKYNTKLTDKINAQGNKMLSGAENAAIENEVGAELAQEGVKAELVSDEKDGTYRIFDTKNTDLLGYIEATPELIEKISDPNLSEQDAKQILFEEAGVELGDNVLIHANENDITKYKPQEDVKAETYISKLEDTKKQDPSKYFSVSVPSAQDIKEGTVVQVKGGEAVVDKSGEIKGLYKYADTEERDVGDKLIKKAIEAGGIKLDNFTIPKLMEIYEGNGFRVTSRLPFSEKDAPTGWDKKKNGTPDVVAMVYDPENKLDIEEKQFTDYDEAMAYRDSFIDAQKEAYGDQQPSQDEEAKKKSIADIIRGLKSKGGKLYSAGLGIPVAIWDGAVEIVASAVEAGESISKALNKAKKYLKDNLKDKYNEDVFNKLKEETEKQSGEKSNVLNIDIESVRKKDRPGKRISKGLAKKAENKKEIFSETDDISIDYVKKNAPVQFIKNAKIIAEYPLVKAVLKGKKINTVEDAQKVYDVFVRQVADNLKYLMDQFDPEFKDIATLWYDGANAIANDLANEYGITPEQVAGILASLSPQKDWYQNVRLAELVLMAYKDNPVLSQEMLDYQKTVIEKGLYKGAKSPGKQLQKAENNYKKSKTKLNKQALDEAKQKLENAIKDSDDLMSMLEEYLGKKMDEVPEYIQPYMVRTYHEVNTTKDYDIITPDGNKAGVAKKAKGGNAKVAWGSYGEIGKAVSIYNNGSPDNITRTLGEMHKIRNFNNNIIDPMSEDGDVTIDTHAVAAALLIPLSGNSKEVKQNFGTGTGNSPALGIKGLYFAYADAYALAANESGLLPRQIQSITWEAVRGLYTASFKGNKKNVEDIKQIWKKYEDGEITIDEARELAKERAGGVNKPTWATGSLIDEPGESDQEEIDDAGVDGDGSDTIGSEREQPVGDLLTEAVDMLSDAEEAGGSEITKAQKEVSEKLGEEGKKIAEIDRNFDKLADDLGFIKTCII